MKKKKMQFPAEFCSFLKISLFIILPAYIQILALVNHSAEHEFSILKLNLLFIFGTLLFSYVIFMFCKTSLNSPLKLVFKIKDFSKRIVINRYIALVTIFIVFFISVNQYPDKIYSYYSNRKKYIRERAEYFSYEVASVISEINDYENVFFSFTESIPDNPPHSLVFAKKKVYRIDNLNEINDFFSDLDDHAVKMFVINKNNTEKTEDILRKEQYIIENFKPVKKQNGYEIYSLKPQNLSRSVEFTVTDASK
jgi:hypothetical protein